VAYKTFVTATLSTCVLLSAAMAPAHERDTGRPGNRIKHVVIIFQENASFDHYFATYPDAKNTDGVRFVARPDTPTVNGLTDGNSQFPERVNVGLHDFNPNQTVGAPVMSTGANPFRMTRDQIVTCSNNHAYKGEQLATDAGFMDKFPQQNAQGFAGCATV
jgi:phospholipase C